MTNLKPNFIATDEPVLTKPPIYLDHHATTPVDSRVAAVMMEAMLQSFGNANSSEHRFGETARKLVVEARTAVADLVGAEPDHVHFTSGSTEAIQLSIAHAIGRDRRSPLRIAVSRVEHRAVIDTGLLAERLGLAEIVWIDVDNEARLLWSSLETALSGGAELVCVMAANNEIGTVYPIQAIADLVLQHGAALLVDGTQGAGRTGLNCADCTIDYLVLSAHKLYGPKGVGALISDVFKASDTYGLSASHQPTPNVPAIAGMGKAARLMLQEASAENRRMAELRDRLETALRHLVPGIVINGDRTNRLPQNLHFSAPGAPNDVVTGRLRNVVALSTGSACNSGADSPSHVLQAMGLSEALMDTCLRIGVGRGTTIEDVDQAAKDIAQAIEATRRALTGEER
ncbi:cysteine desulfurase family protein [Agrobacterium rosae]|uniref:Cysteine desulfurase n=1 Tax=Agrobacterium rosae TaxID=1972867 RepID=A0AAW9FIT7_9HYPH|nr:cysteine desulfurase family protein [Agrobacterium rosae]MDX8304358.1 cysteine desulfurase family protein [Agrobacterium rosae]